MTRGASAISKTRIRDDSGGTPSVEEPGVTRRSVIGPYHLEKEIGRGGMSTVYKAWDRRNDTACALKVLRSSVASEGTSSNRFRREVETVRRLDHDHVVPILDHGSDQGLSYIAMRLIEGQTVSDLVQRSVEWSTAVDEGKDRTVATTVTRGIPRSDGWWDPRRGTTEQRFRQMAGAMAPIADALQSAHDRGILHRDVKPSNLLSDADGKLWLTDFGLASAAEAQTVVTHSGQILGTPNYMSPEQASGTKDLDCRTDVYSLGATLYECVTGRKPYRGDSFRVLLEIASGKLIPPSQLREDLPGNLEAIILKAMAFDPADRYQSGTAFAEDLRRYSMGKPTVARLPGLADKAIRLISHHPREFAFGVGLLLVLLTTAIVIQSLFASKDRENLARVDNVNRTLEDVIRDLHSSELLLRKQAYISDMSSAFDAYANRDNDAAQQFLRQQVPDIDGIDLRRSEWWLLHHLTRPFYRFQLQGHGGAVREARLVETLGQVVSAGDDATIRRWDKAGQPIGKLIQLDAEINALAVSPDGQVVYAGQNSDGSTRSSALYSLSGGEELQRLTAHANSIESAAFSPDGQWIVTADRYGELLIHDRSGKFYARYESGSRNESVVFTEDNRQVAAIWRDPNDPRRRQSLRFWSVPDLKPIHTITLVEFSPHHVDLADGGKLAVLASRSEFALIDLSNGQEVGSVVPVRGGIRTVDLSSTGDRLAIGCDNGLLYQWEVNCKEDAAANRIQLSEPLVTPLGEQKLTSVRITKADEVVVASENGSVYRCGTRRGPFRFCELPKSIYSIAELTGKNGSLYARSEDGKVCRFDPASRTSVDLFDAPPDAYREIAFSPLHGQVAVGAHEQLMLFSLSATEQPISMPLGIPEKDIRWLRYSEDQSRLELLLNDRILVVDPLMKEERKEVMLPREGALSLTLSPDGKTLVVTTNEELIFLDSANYEVLNRKIIEGSLMSEATEFANSGNLLAVTHEDGTIRLQQFIADGRKLEPGRVLRGHRDSVLDLAFLDQDQTLVSVSCDGTIRFWDVEQGREMGVLPTAEDMSLRLHDDPERGVLMSFSTSLPTRIYSTGAEDE